MGVGCDFSSVGGSVWPKQSNGICSDFNDRTALAVSWDELVVPHFYICRRSSGSRSAGLRVFLRGRFQFDAYPILNRR